MKIQMEHQSETNKVVVNITVLDVNNKRLKMRATGKEISMNEQVAMICR